MAASLIYSDPLRPDRREAPIDAWLCFKPRQGSIRMTNGVEEAWLLLRLHARPAYGLVRLTQEETYVGDIPLHACFRGT